MHQKFENCREYHEKTAKNPEKRVSHLRGPPMKIIPLLKGSPIQTARTVLLWQLPNLMLAWAVLITIQHHQAFTSVVEAMMTVQCGLKAFRFQIASNGLDKPQWPSPAASGSLCPFKTLLVHQKARMQLRRWGEQALAMYWQHHRGPH